MRSWLLPIFIGSLLALAGWRVGRGLASPRFAALALAEDGAAAVALPVADAPLNAADFREAIVAPGGGASGMANDLAFYELAARLAREDFPAAMEALRDAKSGRLAKLLEIWAERDVAAASGWFAAQPAETQRDLFHDWSQTWARLDADGLRKWLAGRPEEERAKLDGKYGDEPLTRLLADRDPEAALTLSQLYPTLLPAWTVLEQWAARDPAMAATRALALPGGQHKSDAIHFVARAWSRQNPEAALDWIEQLEDPAARDTARNALVMVFAGKNPIAAAETIRARFPPDRQADQWRMVAAFGAKTDPEAVIAWAQKQTDPEVRRTMIAEVLRNMTARDSGAASGLWPPPDPSMPRSDARRTAELWLAESQQSAKPLDGGREVLAALAKNHGLAEAVRFLDRTPPPLAEGVKDAASVLANVAGWPAIADAAMAMPPGARRTEWIAQAVAGLLQSGEIDAVQNVVARLPAGAERDGAVQSVAAALLPDDPDAGAQMLLALPDGEARLREQARRWLADDPREAKRWLAKTDALSAEEIATLLAAPATFPNP